MFVNVKMIPVETVPGMGGGEIKENCRRVNSSMIYLMYYKNFCKSYNVPHSSTILKNNLRIIVLSS
jgi:hypothetical protein